MGCQSIQRRTVRRVDLLAVDEYLAINPQHAQAPKTRQLISLQQGIVNFIRLIRWLRRRHVQLVPGLGDKFAEPLLKVLRLINQPQHHIAQAIQLRGQNIRRVLARRYVRVGVTLAAQFTLQNIISKAAEQLTRVRRAIAN